MPRTLGSADSEIRLGAETAWGIMTDLPKTISTVASGPVWMTEPAARILPATSGCHLPSPNEYLASPAIRTTVATPGLIDCAVALATSVITQPHLTTKNNFCMYFIMP